MRVRGGRRERASFPVQRNGAQGCGRGGVPGVGSVPRETGAVGSRSMASTVASPPALSHSTAAKAGPRSSPIATDQGSSTSRQPSGPCSTSSA